jgi:uncharacterized protein YjbI with pentapeptide repeats
MRPRTLTALAAVGLGVAAPVALAAQPTTLGTGAKTCTLKPGADCSRVVHKWTAEFHGDAHRAKFTKADLRGADFRGADLHGADFRGAKLRHADLRGAKLKGARFDTPPKSGKQANGINLPDCALGENCVGADLAGANLSWADMDDVNFTRANLTGANLTRASFGDANLTGANLTHANLYGANFERANLTGANLTDTTLTGTILAAVNLTNANLTGAIGFNRWSDDAGGVTWNNTTCFDGTVTNTGCW